MKLLRLLPALLATACAATTPATNEPARNVILFIGDGMGVSTATAAGIFDRQSKGMSGEEHTLPCEHFPNAALVKTCNTNQHWWQMASRTRLLVT